MRLFPLKECGDECAYRVQDYCLHPKQTSRRGMTPILPGTKFENGFPRWCPLEEVDERQERTPEGLATAYFSPKEG